MPVAAQAVALSAAVAAAVVAASIVRSRQRRTSLVKRHANASSAKKKLRRQQQQQQQRNAVGEGGVQRRSRFRAKQSDTRVICCPSTKEYLATISKVVGNQDRVLVIGRHVKNAESNPAMRQAAESAGSSDCVRGYGGALWDIEALLSLSGDQNSSGGGGGGAGGGFSVVCLEVGDVFGNDVVCDGQALVRLVRSVFAKSLAYIVVKSRQLALHARTYLNAHRVTAGLLESRVEAGQAWSGAGRKGTPGAEVPIVVCAVGVRDYRNVIPHVVLPGDTVLEIGCALGKTTHHISVQAAGPSGRVIGIDNGRRCIRDAQAQHDSRRRKALLEVAAVPAEKSGSVGEENVGRCEFSVADAWDTAGLLKISPFFNSIFVDVGGISGSDGELEVGRLLVHLPSNDTSWLSAA